jgi:hypothetical protein
MQVCSIGAGGASFAATGAVTIGGAQQAAAGRISAAGSDHASVAQAGGIGNSGNISASASSGSKILTEAVDLFLALKSLSQGDNEKGNGNGVLLMAMAAYGSASILAGGEVGAAATNALAAGGMAGGVSAI